ncbi:hypothetical protein FB45DRAFT_860004 [Roridomyces roridus]|uniref:Uncharacterized protein n=1 Tax=Roridomyces roridus TaxID=1738132 RepID=A0AAD7CDK8_9AGAR|nr:hypothetical protein FB45DRAFT_860004 [Roridomyces roridus]
MDASPSFGLPSAPVSPASLAHLLASNSAPDALESHIASAHIAELEKHRVLVEKVPRLHIGSLAQLIEAHTAILSLLRRLPNELLAEIFKLAIREAISCIDQYGVGMHTARLRVTAVKLTARDGYGPSN